MVTKRADSRGCRFYFRRLGQMILLSLGLASASLGHSEPLPIDHVVAVVNDDVILASQLDERTRAVYQQLAQKGGNLPPPELVRPQILEQLILENLQIQLAERASVSISKEELQNAIVGIARQGGLSPDQLRQKVESEGMSYQAFQKAIERELLLQRTQQGAVNKRIDITEQDITNYLNSEEGKLRSADSYRLAHIVLNFPAADESARAAVLKQAEQLVQRAKTGTAFEELAARYSQSPDRQNGGDLGWRALKDLPSLYVETAQQLGKGDVSPPLPSDSGVSILKLLDKRGKDAQWVQQSHARHILVKTSVIRNEQEAVELLKQLRERALAGEDFAELAKRYSEDFGTALKGGDLGWTSPGQLVPQFQEVMDNSALQAVSDPFQSPYGWHILQVLERRTENMTEELIRQSVGNFLARRRFESELPLWLQELRAEAYIVIKDPALQLPKD